MKTKQRIVLVIFSFGFLIFLILPFVSSTTHGMSNRNVVARAKPQPVSLKMLARVVRYCEENNKPMHPGITGWASASLTTDANHLVQTDSSTAAGLFRREYK